MLKIGAVKEGIFSKNFINEDGNVRDSVYFSFLNENGRVSKTKYF